MKLKVVISMAIIAIVAASPAFAVPSLQLGPGPVGDWTYNNTTETWETTTNPFSLYTYANDGLNGGANPWDAAGQTDRYAYFVVSAVPMVNFDGFDVSVTGDGGALTLVGQGFGAPPVSDPNSLAPHAIFDTWFEIYEFQFDGGQVLNIPDTQTGAASGNSGYREEISVNVISLAAGVTGVHMDLFTMEGDGDIQNLLNTDVNAFAPFSHDAQGNPIPEPGSLMLLGMGLAGMGVVYRRRRKN